MMALVGVELQTFVDAMTTGPLDDLVFSNVTRKKKVMQPRNLDPILVLTDCSL